MASQDLQFHKARAVVAAAPFQESHTLQLGGLGDPGEAEQTSSKCEADRGLVRRVSYLGSREITGLFITLFSPLYENMQQSKAYIPLLT